MSCRELFPAVEFSVTRLPIFVHSPFVLMIEQGQAGTDELPYSCLRERFISLDFPNFMNQTVLNGQASRCPDIQLARIVF